MLRWRVSMLNRLLVLTCLLLPAGGAMAQSSELDDLKAVYIYNFLAFIDWPAAVDTADQYRLCVVAHPPLSQRLLAVVKNEKVNGRTIAVADVDVTQPLNRCHLLYLPDKSWLSEQELLHLQQQGVLLVGDYSGFVSSPVGMMGFEVRARKVRVAIRLAALQQAGFKVSSKLLRVVRIAE